MSAQTLECPRCAGALFVKANGNVSIGPCFDCGGIWMSADAAATVGATLDDKTALEAQGASQRAVAPMPLRTGGQALSCPVCSQQMARFLVSDVEVDNCATHGSWFDHGEHEKVVAHLRGQPGLTTTSADTGSGLELAHEPTRGAARQRVMRGVVNAQQSYRKRHDHESDDGFLEEVVEFFTDDDDDDDWDFDD